MKSICVFCGSSLGKDKIYAEAATALGKLLAQSNIRLIYGGAQVGLMGTVADAVLNHGGQVTGVLPHFLSNKEIAHHYLTELILVGSMHERKLKMSELADGFIALPGGMGTMEELCEILTWSQLGLHQKPSGILNISNYYSYLSLFFENMVTEGFLKETHRSMVMIADNPEQLLQQMKNYQPPIIEKWLNKSDT